MAAGEITGGMVQRVLQRRGLRQFGKFLIVGASSTAISFTVFYLLIEILHIHQYLASPDLARLGAELAAFLVSVTNGFYWNSRWTFRHAPPGSGRSRYAKFLLTNVIGLCLSVTLTVLVARLAPAAIVALLGQFLHRDPAAFFGKAVATAVVVFWNFSASKYWTFKG